MHIILVGASHGWRLFRSLKRIPGYGITFTVTCLCVRGAKFADLNWPQTVKESDFLVVIPFGNDVTNRKNIKFDRETGIIHLVKFVPHEKEHWKFLFTKLQQKLSDKNCKILVIDNFYRHLCCDTHRHKGWLSYQTQINKELREQFKDSQIKVVDHRYLLSNPRICKANVLEYRKLQGDSVHFRDYSPIAENLLKCIKMFF
jgi:stalled ribosome alternative rescue factor ArfA